MKYKIKLDGGTEPMTKGALEKEEKMLKRILFVMTIIGCVLIWAQETASESKILQKSNINIESIAIQSSETVPETMSESGSSDSDACENPEEQRERIIHSNQDEAIIPDYEGRGTDVMVTDRHKPNSHPVIAGSGSFIYAACEGYYSGYPCIGVYRSSNYGQSWQFVTGWYYSSSTYEAYFPSIAVTSSYVVVTYDRRENGALAAVFCARIPRGGSTATFYAVDDPDRGTSDITAYGSTVYCVYRYNYSGSDWDIEFKHSTNGGATWSSRVTVAGLWPISLPLELPKICAVTSNILVATWQHSSSGTYRVDWSKSTNGGSSWSASGMFTAQLWYPDVTANQNTYLITCQSYSTNILTYVYTFDSGNSWSAHTGLSGSRYPQCAYGNGFYRAVYTRNSRVYYSAASSPDQLGNGGAITDLATAQNDALGIIPISSPTSLCVWKDSRNGTSIYSDQGEVGIEENIAKNTAIRSLVISPTLVSDYVTIRYELQMPADITIEIFDITGRKIKTLEKGIQSAGNHILKWYLQDDIQCPVPSGVYFIKFKSDSDSDTKQIVVLK
ncbi:MAG: T9SS type A sorting domain-containing protein [bacterium]